MSNLIDVNNDFLIQPYLNAVMIQQPTKDNAQESKKNLSVKELFKFPFNVYFQLPGGWRILNCNEQVLITHHATTFGYTSVREFINSSIDKFATSSYIQRVKQNDRRVIESNQLTIIEETADLLDDNGTYDMISFKFPCFWNTRKAPIIFGMSILLDNEFFPSSASLAEGLTILFQSGLLTQYPFVTQFLGKCNINGVYITTQQLKCLQLACRGLTAKQIAIRLNISYRTVEKHIANLKHKLKVKSKSELIEKFMYYRS